MFKAVMSDLYKPVSCAIHSEYELAIMHGQTLCIQWQTNSDEQITEVLKPFDVITDQGAEYLIVQDINGSDKKIRLDKIIEAHPVNK